MASTVQTLELKGRTSGILWSQRPVPSKQGHILQVTHTRGGTRTSDGHLLRFSRLLFDPRGTTLALDDQQGNLFLLNLDTNRFAEVGSPHDTLVPLLTSRPCILLHPPKR